MFLGLHGQMMLDISKKRKQTFWLTLVIAPYCWRYRLMYLDQFVLWLFCTIHEGGSEQISFPTFFYNKNISTAKYIFFYQHQNFPFYLQHLVLKCICNVRSYMEEYQKVRPAKREPTSRSCGGLWPTVLFVLWANKKNLQL